MVEIEDGTEWLACDKGDRLMGPRSSKSFRNREIEKLEKTFVNPSCNENSSIKRSKIIA